MTTDYDAPRTAPEDEEPVSDVLEMTRVRGARGAAATRVPLIDDTETDESMELPEADLSETGLTVHVVPQQHDEFLCESCFLVCHRSQLAQHADGQQICLGCHA